MEPTLTTAERVLHCFSLWGFSPRALISRANVILGLLCFFGISFCHAVERTWNGLGAADWSVASNWNPVGVPGSNDTAVINSGYALLYVETTLAGLTLTGGEIGATGSINVRSNFAWTGGTLSGGGSTTIALGATLTITGSDNKHLGIGGASGRTLINYGRATWSGSGTFYSYAATFYNATSGIFDVQTDATYKREIAGNPSSFVNVGTFRKSAGTVTNTFYEQLINGGLLQIQTGGLGIGILENYGSPGV